MGTDIHLDVQVKQTNGPWRSVDVRVGAARERNYNLFALLAGVRNGIGFAGCPTGLPVVPLFAGRGWPSDYSAPRDDEKYMCDHSLTWATLRELQGVPWSLVFRSCGVIGEGRYKTWTGGVPFGGWSGDVCGKGVVVIEEADYAATRHTVHSEVAESYCYVRVWWDWHPLADCAFRKWVDGLDHQALGASSVDDVRVVIGFDS